MTCKATVDKADTNNKILCYNCIMKLKNIITFSILIALSFSIVHEFAFAAFDENQCSVSEFVNEFDAPTGADDICDIHYEYHQAFMYPNMDILIPKIDKISELQIKKETYTLKITQDLVIPPLV